jgi:hypothetical protein
VDGGDHVLGVDVGLHGDLRGASGGWVRLSGPPVRPLPAARYTVSYFT